MSETGDQLEAARGGSREALGQALDACRAYLLKIAEQDLDPALRPKGGASDLVQQTFLEAHRDFERFTGGSEQELLAWLRQLLRNNLANFTRDYRQTDKRRIDREVALDTPDSSGAPAGQVAADTTSPSGHAMAEETADLVRRAMERLPDDYRRVLHLRYEEGRSFDEIGTLLDRSANAARKLWARAVELLEVELSRGGV
jgi:RNA polymerase sigma-70 factor (ECF subfamily)